MYNNSKHKSQFMPVCTRKVKLKKAIADFKALGYKELAEDYTRQLNELNKKQ